MASKDTPSIPKSLDVRGIDFIAVLDHLDEGVIITDIDGVIHYYNATQAEIDELDPQDVIGKKVTDIYELSGDTSLIMLCVKIGRPIRNRTFFYKTKFGKVANTIHSIFPIYSGGNISGTICFVRDYKILKRTTPVISVPDLKPKKKNGTRYTFADIIGSNRHLVRSIKTAREAANSASPIMLIGETGTGKELFAQSIHNYSGRSNRNYVAVNCAAIPENLLEGVLFGTSRGAFTGAVDKPGLLERANGSTLFLDELLAMPMNLQAKLLRVLQEKKVRRVGSLDEIELDIKIISAVSGPPREAIKKNELRTDLFYRIGVVMVKIPPLRERIDDLTELIHHFLLRLNRSLGTNVQALSDNVMELFTSYRWPGNVRELEHLLEGAMNIVGYDEVIDVQHFSAAFESMDSLDYIRNLSLYNQTSVPEIGSRTAATDFSASEKSLKQSQREQERSRIYNALLATEGNVTVSAKKLGISRQLLHYKMKKYGFTRTDFISADR